MGVVFLHLWYRIPVRIAIFILCVACRTVPPNFRGACRTIGHAGGSSLISIVCRGQTMICKFVYPPKQSLRV